MARTTFGVVVGTRGFFPTRLAQEGRLEILRILKEEGFETVCLGAREADRFGEGFCDGGFLFASRAGR
ncbi:MAG: hypothetical protein NTX40_00470 [Planctomycetota bacterium]|nr:hypothetical protein [Planctomycetota bacterium]